MSVTGKPLSRGQKVVLGAAFVPMLGTGVAGGVGTYSNISTMFGSGTAVGAVAAGEGATAVLAIVLLGLTMLGQSSPRVIRAGLWALVTSNYEHRVRGRFERTGLPVPGVVVDAASVTEGKPSPVPYLLAAEKLGADPADCLVIEDAPSGVASGLAAGMTVWTVNTEAPHPGAHRHFRTLAEAAPHLVATLA